MNKLKLVLLLSLFTVSILNSCSKSEDSGLSISEPNIIITASKAVRNSSGRYDSIPAYWVNGVEKPLANFNVQTAASSAMAVSKTGKVHLIGVGYNNVYQYWIDGVEQNIPAALKDIGWYIHAVVKDEKFHLIGYKANKYAYWIDGVEQSLPANFDPNDISVSADGSTVALISGDKFLINGIVNTAPFGSILEKIVTVGSDVYTAGTDGYGIRYWVNGVKHELYNSTTSLFTGTTLAVVEGKVHVFTIVNSYDSVNSKVIYTPKYWIDGIEQPLPQGATRITGITSFEGKTYIVGYAGGVKVKYWVDGVAHDVQGAIGYGDRDNMIYVFRK